MQTLYQELEDRGLVMIALNSGDSPEAVSRYAKEEGFTFLIGLMGRPDGGNSAHCAAKYGAQGYPTSYVLDGQGKVVWRGVGAAEGAIRETLAKLGVAAETAKGQPGGP